MKINVFGLGYVGGVNAVCLAAGGHEVRGIDVVRSKAEAFAAGRLPMFEPRLAEVQASIAAAGGKLTATVEPNGTLCQAEASIVCVGTPALDSGEVDTGQLDGTLRQIAEALAGASQRHTVIVRSTVPPGTCEQLLLPLLEDVSGRKAGRDFGFAFYPEFLREGMAVTDFFEPSVNIAGASDVASLEVVREIFAGKTGIKSVKLSTAEMIKYVNNTFHALKVSFANEIGSLCQAQGVDVDELVSVFLSDRVLNISERYLRPGAAFGGPCLPKEVKAIVRQFERSGVRAPVVGAILDSNDAHVRRFLAAIEASRAQRVGVLGLAFKPDTDDLRGSPVLPIIDRLLAQPSYKTRKLSVCDRAETLAKARALYGDKLNYVVDDAELVRSCELLVLGPRAPGPAALKELERFEGVIIDMKFQAAPVGLRDKVKYVAIC